jgi:hypothetical protein
MRFAAIKRGISCSVSKKYTHPHFPLWLTRVRSNPELSTCKVGLRIANGQCYERTIVARRFYFRPDTFCGTFKLRRAIVTS